MVLCLTHEISSLLVTNFDEEGNRIDDPDFETFHLMTGPKLPEDAEKEKKIKAIFKAMLNGKTGAESLQLAKSVGVEDGCELLLEVFRSGGI